MLLKTIKIFLKLKWRETLGNVPKKEWIFYLISTMTLIFSYIIGKYSKLEPAVQNESPVVKHILYIMIGFFILLLAYGIISLFIFIIKKFIKFCKWIASNWQEAKRIAKNVK